MLIFLSTRENRMLKYFNLLLKVIIEKILIMLWELRDYTLMCMKVKEKLK